jgi:MvdD-like protein with pre-ATP grasp domain
MILILTEPKDLHANLVEARLRQRGARICRFDWSEFPRTASLSVEFRGGRKHVWLKRGGERLDLTECTAGWLRRPGKPLTPGTIPDALLRHYADEECLRLVQDIWNALDIPCLPGPLHAIRGADNKQLQLQLATELGLEIPPTLITSDPDEFLEFYREHEGRLIDKFPSTVMAASQRTGGSLMRFTQAVTTRDVGYARRLRHSPMLFQAQIPKRFELRITVVGDQVLPAEIHSQATRRTQLDWRHYDWGHTPYRVHRLPDAIRRACLEMVSRLGLRFGAIDMIVTPDGRYVFLEINPNGQWMWIEDETGLPIAEAICDTLLNPAGHSPTPLPHVPLEAHP